ncbi:hypothetical protein HQQ94_04000 [Shewanella sp. VB17]|uniref:hypothetical protein n=1 Tax=Shewanella sp. VB17 TaxID=2739432 RepID=UPI001565E876|nr:hypothetical protein [Shewanella sp. VB17]NRD72420.1 hypothetical protein [Shewanella sp. VB17]
MYNTVKTPIWYGELRTARGNAIVIHDKQFPDASAGRIYLYNTERDSIIEYAEEIVQNNLHDLDKESKKAAENTYGAAWDFARKEFMDKHDGWVEVNNTSTHKSLANSAKEPPVKKNIVEQADNTDTELEDDYESQDPELANNWPDDVED